jgi:hypothetical protein
LKEDEDLQSINTHGNFLDAVKNAADYIKMKPPRVPPQTKILSSEEEEEEKKEISEIN